VATTSPDLISAFAFHRVESAQAASELKAEFRREGGAVTQARLLGYYMSRESPSEDEVRAKIRHLVELIRSHPTELFLACALDPNEDAHHPVAVEWREQANARASWARWQKRPF
jgi:hypothetical protein